MAKAFDLVHKINRDETPEESRIPFEDDNTSEQPQPKPKRPKVEMAFFYILLFIIFFIMGLTLLSPNFFAGVAGNKTANASPSPANTPQQGFTIEKDGQSVEQASKDLGSNKVTPVPTAATSTPSTAPAESTAPAPTTETKNAAAKIQILNGTNITGGAATARTKLANKGIVVASIGNFKTRTVKRTTIYYKPEYKTAATQVQGVLGGIISSTEDGIGSYDILVVIGQSS